MIYSIMERENMVKISSKNQTGKVLVKINQTADWTKIKVAVLAHLAKSVSQLKNPWKAKSIFKWKPK